MTKCDVCEYSKPKKGHLECTKQTTFFCGDAIRRMEKIAVLIRMQDEKKKI